MTAAAVLAKDFLVERDGGQIPITELAHADMARAGTTDPDLAEWVVAVSWLKSLPREQAVKDSTSLRTRTALSASRTGTRSRGCETPSSWT